MACNAASAAEPPLQLPTGWCRSQARWAQRLAETQAVLGMPPGARCNSLLASGACGGYRIATHYALSSSADCSAEAAAAAVEQEFEEGLLFEGEPGGEGCGAYSAGGERGGEDSGEAVELAPVASRRGGARMAFSNVLYIM